MKRFFVFLAVVVVPGILLGQDVTPPPAPIGLTSTPASWANINSFSVDWTNPSDPSGIGTTYWYKAGAPPTSDLDGTTTTSKPFLLTSVTGSRSVYVWLQDGVGNRSYLNNAITTMYYDPVVPNAVSLSINSGATVTASLIVTLSNLFATDATSGVAGMQFSNDNTTWSSPEGVVSSRSNWDLSLYGGNAAAGTKTAYMRAVDRAGNTSTSISAQISYDPVSPVQLVGFRAKVIETGCVQWAWETVSEINNYGFVVECAPAAGGPFALVPGTFIAGQGTTNAAHRYSCEATVAAAAESYYRLRQIDLDGILHYSESVQAGTALDVVEATRLAGFALHQNYPNPFNPATTIRYALPQMSAVQISVFNTLGQPVAVLQNGEQEAGYHEVRFDASGMASGVYFYRMTAGAYVETRKLLLLR